jgi:hypothetical protein
MQTESLFADQREPFFNTIGQDRHFGDVRATSVPTPTTDV